MPVDTIDHWFAVKLTTEDVAKQWGLLWSVRNREAAKCGDLVLAQDSTIRDERRRREIAEALTEQYVQDYKDVVRASNSGKFGRTLRDIGIAVAAFLVGRELSGR